jgi:hypothetical protein
MSRRSQFQPGRQPLEHHHHHILRHLNIGHVTGPISFLNPTRAYYDPSIHSVDSSVQDLSVTEKPSEPKPASPLKRLWRSRDNRKGRHALVVDYESPESAKYILPQKTSTLRAAAKGIWLMVSYYPYWDVSWLVATIFTFGSVIWVINSFFEWLPLVDPSTEFTNEAYIGGGVTAFIGATIFEVGSVLLLLEAVNENQAGCFGWAVETVVHQFEGKNTGSGSTSTSSTKSSTNDDNIANREDNEQSAMVETALRHVKPAPDECEHHHRNRRSFLKSSERILREGLATSDSERTFKWLPSLEELRTHYLHELGFLASVIQFIGASIFWIAGLTGLPGIINHLSTGVADGVFWVPQIVGGSCFVISGLLFTIETQPKWYIPAPRVLGWHIGTWNFIGGIGFTLCGALGPGAANSGVAYQSSLATFWGSWAFLVGSTIQWYESLDKHPVEEVGST